MLALTIRQVEGLVFYADVEIVEPREKRHGVYIEVLYRKEQLKEMRKILTCLGFRYGGLDKYSNSELWVLSWWRYWWFSTARYFFKSYWWLCWFLYKYGRVFQEVPVGYGFSWQYFTPIFVLTKLCRYVIIPKLVWLNKLLRRAKALAGLG